MLIELPIMCIWKAIFEHLQIRHWRFSSHPQFVRWPLSNTRNRYHLLIVRGNLSLFGFCAFEFHYFLLATSASPIMHSVSSFCSVCSLCCAPLSLPGCTLSLSLSLRPALGSRTSGLRLEQVTGSSVLMLLTCTGSSRAIDWASLNNRQRFSVRQFPTVAFLCQWDSTLRLLL